MSRRSSSLNQIDSGLSREIGSNFDNVKKVADNIGAVVEVAATDLAGLAAALEEAKDFTGITVVVGEPASWDAVNKILTVPAVKGDKGDPGADGLDGSDGVDGLNGKDGVNGKDITISNITYQGNGVFIWEFSDGTNYTTPDIRGSKGDTGERGISVHHLKGTNTTDPEGDFGTTGEVDTYTFYGDDAETIVLGYFKVGNGIQSANEAEALGLMTRRIYDVDGDGIVDDSTRLGGKTLAEIEQERAADILAAQLALGTNYTVADNTARLALTGLTVGDKVFVSDDGDGKWAQYWVTAVTDGLGSTSTFEVVMDEDTYLNANTAASIKAAYESNLDTNAYTDAEKTLVDVGTALGTTATTLPGAVNELHGEVNAIVDGTTDIAFDNLTSGLVATTVEGAINEVEGRVDTAETNIGSMALSTTSTDLTGAVNEVHGELDSHIAQVTDAHDASAISYVNTTSGMVAVDVQGAIDEVEARVDLADTHRTSDGSDHTFIDQDVTTTASPTFANVVTSGLVDGRDVSVDGAKLDTIEVNAKDDQVASEVPVTPVGNISSTNVQTALEEIQTDLDTHKASTGAEHTYIDQDVTTIGTPRFNSVQLNGGTGTQGLFSWNADEETVDLVQNGSVLQVGQEHLVQVRNNTVSTIANGTPLMYAGTIGNSSRILVEPMDGTVQANAMRFLGFATTDIAAGGDGKATILGKVKDIDTTGTAVSETWLDGDILYISPTTVGALTKVEPTAAQLDMAVAVVVHAHSAGSLYVRAITVDRNDISPAIQANYYNKTEVDAFLAQANTNAIVYAIALG